MSDYPSVFMRVPETLVGHGQPLVRPPESVQLDYEGEIADRDRQAGGRRIPRERAQDHIAALTCVNEGCVRDWMRHGKFNVTQGKNFDRCGAVGPWLVTADEFPDGYGDLRRDAAGSTARLRQDDSTANLIFDFAWLVELRLDLDDPRARRRHLHRHADRGRGAVRPAALAGPRRRRRGRGLRYRYAVQPGDRRGVNGTTCRPRLSRRRRRHPKRASRVTKTGRFSRSIRWSGGSRCPATDP